MAKGHFTATPLTFELDGVSHQYAGRGRWSCFLSQLIVNTKTAPARQKDGSWSWRDATVEELAAAQKLVDKVATKAQVKADAAVAKATARAARAANKPARVRKAKAVEAPVTVAETAVASGSQVSA